MEEPTDGTKGEGNYTGVYRSNAEIADWKPIVEGDRKSAVLGMEAKNEEGSSTFSANTETSRSKC